MSKPLAVIILNWNGLKLLQQFLPTAAEYTIDDRTDLIVADNGSSDGSVEWVRQNLPQVKLVQFSQNHGFAEGYNRAIAETQYKYTVLLNSDVEVTPGWARPLLDFMESHPEAGACQPKIRSWRSKEMFEYAGAAGGYLDKHGYPYCRGRILDKVEPDRGQYDEPHAVEVAWASGAALMVRTKAYVALGGLDARFFAHMEEIDLCCRMWGQGWKVYALSDSWVYHVGGASLNQGNPKKTYLNFRNNLLLLYKNLPSHKRSGFLFRRRLLDTLPFLKFVATGDLKNAMAVLKAHRDFRSMRKFYTETVESDYFLNLPGRELSLLQEALK